MPVRCVPVDTTVSAVAVPAERAMVDTLSSGIWLVDDDLLGEPPPTAGSGVSEAPVAVTSVLFVVLIIL